MATAHALAAHPAIGADDEALGRDELQGAPDVVGHLFRPLDLQGVMVDDTDRDLLVDDALPDGFEIDAAGAAGFEGDRVGFAPIEIFDRGLVALNLGKHALLRGIAPAAVAPDLGLVAQSFDGVVVDFHHEVRVDHLVDEAACREQVNLRLLDLDHRATGIRELVQLLAQRVADGEDSDDLRRDQRLRTSLCRTSRASRSGAARSATTRCTAGRRARPGRRSAATGVIRGNRGECGPGETIPGFCLDWTGPAEDCGGRSPPYETADSSSNSGRRRRYRIDSRRQSEYRDRQAAVQAGRR